MTRTHEVTSSHPQRSVPLSFQDRRSSHPAEIDEKPLQSLQKISESIGLINGCEIVLGFFFEQVWDFFWISWLVPFA
jgi:hypothetical protein